MISETGSVEAMLRSPAFPPFASNMDHSRLDRMDPMQNQLCRVCEEPAAGFHFGAFTCEGCKSFFGRTCNNQSVIQECKNNYRCVVDKKNRTACKACRLRKCLMVGMSKSGSRYGRRSNWFKIHCLMQQSMHGSGGGGGPSTSSPPSSSTSSSSLSPTNPLLWSSPAKTEVKEENREASPSSSPEPPTMVPRVSSFRPTSSHIQFQSLIPSLSPVGSHRQREIPVSLAGVPVSASASALPITSMYSGFPSPLSLISSASGFSGIPFHKQALLSPLLAHSHLWQMAASRHPFFGGLRPDLDLLAEHKALMERFAQSQTVREAAAAVAAATAAAAAAAEQRERSPSPSKSPEPLQQDPIDLSSGKKAKVESKKDVNRNLVIEENVLNLCSKLS